MGIQIAVDLIAVPSVTGLPARIRLRQTLQSNFPGGEAARITYAIDGRSQVVFEGGGTTFQVVGVHVPQNMLAREDTVGLVRIGGSGQLQVSIEQEIEGVDGTTHDSVVVSIV